MFSSLGRLFETRAQREAREEAARLREIEGARLNAEEIARTYPPEARRAHEARVAANAAANSAYLNSRRAWEANEARKKRDEEAEQAEENRQPRVRKANVDREAAALPNAQLEDSDVPKLKAELKTLPMILDDFLKKLEVRIKKGRVPEATEDEKSVAKEAKQMQLGKKFSPMAQKPRDSPFSEEEFRAARRNQKQLSGDRYEYEQKLFAEPGFGPIRVNPEYPHEVFMEMEDGTARYFESGYPKNDNANPYPYIPIRRTSAVPPAAPGLSAGGSRKKKRSTRSKKNRSRKQK